MPAQQEISGARMLGIVAEGLGVTASTVAVLIAESKGLHGAACLSSLPAAGVIFYEGLKFIRSRGGDVQDNLPPPKLPQRRRTNGLWQDGFPGPPDSVTRFPPVSPEVRDAETLIVVREVPPIKRKRK